MLALESVPTAVPGQWVALKVEAQGSEIKIYLNNRELVAVQDKALRFQPVRLASIKGVSGTFLGWELISKASFVAFCIISFLDKCHKERLPNSSR